MTHSVFSINCLKVIVASLFIVLTINAENTVTADSKPELLSVSMVAPDVVVLKIQAQKVIHGIQMPYQEKEGDQIIKQAQHRFIKRNGLLIGSLVGKESNIMLALDKIVGDTLDILTVSKPESFTVCIGNSTKNIPVLQVFRKTKPVDCVRSPAPENFPLEHFIILKLSNPLKKGNSYKIKFKAGLLNQPEAGFTFNADKLMSEAVHVNQVGFRPDDPLKLAYLSFWMGNGGNLVYPAENSFHLIDVVSGKKVFTGKTKISKAVDDETNKSYTDIHQIDFSGFTKSGKYCVSVEGVGCSFPFEINDEVWKNAFVKSMRGLYCQRSCIALGPPTTNYVRPRGFCPEDGVKVYVSIPKKEGEDPALRMLNPELNSILSSYKLGKSNIFSRIINEITNQTLPNAWGGYMDAGDWDRRASHALMPLMMFDLAEMYGDNYAKMSFNTTDSSDDIPDLINEALWEVDFLKRMQQPDGSVFGAIESGEHPRRGECSWQESLPVMAYSRTKPVAYNYVADGARAALWFRNNKKDDKANEYITSILKAFEWAERVPEENSRGMEAKDSRRLAAAEMYRLTGEKKYHDIFLQTTRFSNPDVPFYTSSKAPETDQQGEAGWTYLMTKHKDINPEIQQNIKNAMVRDADRDVLDCQETDFNWWGGKKRDIFWGALSMPGSHVLCRAHFITKNEKYLKAIVQSTLTGLGANPVNMTYVTGVGCRYPQHLLHEDSYNSNQPIYEGITVGGPIDPKTIKHNNGKKVMQKLYPEAKTWPATESFYDAVMYVPMNEFTVHQTMLPTSFVWGYLAGRK